MKEKNYEAAFLSKWIHARNDSNISEGDFLKILDEALLNFGQKSLIVYAMAYEENPKAILNSFMKYDSIKMACQYLVKYANKAGILKELEGQKDFSEWVNKQKLEEKWKPVLEKFLLILLGVIK